MGEVDSRPVDSDAGPDAVSRPSDAPQGSADAPQAPSGEGPAPGAAGLRRAADLRRRIDDLTRLVSDWVWETDTAFRLTYVSQRTIDLLGYHPLELVGRRFAELGTFVSPEGIVIELKWRAPFRDVEFVTRHQDGEKRIFLVSGLPVHDPRSGAFQGVRGIARDVTESKRTERAFKASEERYRTLYEKTPAMVHSIDREGRLVSVSDHWLACMGYTAGEVIGRPVVDFMTPSSRRHAEATALPEFFRTGICRDVPYQWVRKDGGVIDVLLSATAERDADGAVVRSLAVAVDVTKRKRAEEELRLAGMVFEATADAIMVTDAGNRIRAVNPAFTQITGYTPEEAVGNDPSMLRSGRHDAPFYRAMWESLRDHNRWEGEIWNRRKSGEIYPAWLSIAVVRDEDARATQYVAHFSDITRRKQDEEYIRRRANADALTGLPNRTAFLDRLSVAISSAQREGRPMALLFIDLDDFKKVNDTFGHLVGDCVLVMVAERIRACAREADTVARFGGDEFTIILPGIARAENAASVAEKVIESLSEPFLLDRRQASLGASIGITVFPGDGDNAVTLLRNADLAMYRAKESGPNAYRFFTPEMDSRAMARLSVEGDLRRALRQGDLAVYYQPVLDLKKGRVAGVEALVRWHHARRGVVLPADFVPLAEETGLIVAMGSWVLATASEQVAAWRRAGLGDLELAVNLSSRQLRRGFTPEAVAVTLADTGLGPDRLTFEITENLVMGDTADGIAWLLAVKELGVRLAVDDFGTGYSSVTSLKRLPIDAVKIDRSFICEATDSPEDASLVRTVVAMGHNLGLKVVAEGIESADQLSFLKALKCDFAQGFYLGTPMPAAECAAFLKGFESLPERAPAPVA